MSKQFDRYASFIFLIIGAGFIFESRKISESAYGSNVGPDIFPMGLGIILILLSIRLFVETLRYVQKGKEKFSYDYKRFLIIFISAVMYAYFLEDIGYVIGTFVFLLIGFQTMEKGKWISSIAISGVFSYGIYFLFVEVLKGSLPGFPIWLGM
ncbi:MAG TPA: tripartite tricarboxylate transporter TctB family protein [Bacillus sp. (in: firmicutes)]|nr:tripartite tricarboxylate transporter TctB family protein [Bacillus sp. (in: firmicutes)]